jgi:phage terminase large subunit-like protein
MKHQTENEIHQNWSIGADFSDWEDNYGCILITRVEKEKSRHGRIARIVRW